MCITHTILDKILSFGLTSLSGPLIILHQHINETKLLLPIVYYSRVWIIQQKLVYIAMYRPHIIFDVLMVTKILLCIQLFNYCAQH